eukprot:4852929-Prymnesium_polylepis.1
MRSTFGKLIYLLQDTQQPEIRGIVGFSCVQPVLSVRDELEALGRLEMLNDTALPSAAAPLLPGDEPSRKTEAMDRLLKTYGGGDAELTARLERCLLSIADDEALTEAHVKPVQRMLDLLHGHFDRSSAGSHSLAISAGRGGARLSHSHATQFAYCEQSL